MAQQVPPWRDKSHRGSAGPTWHDRSARCTRLDCRICWVFSALFRAESFWPWVLQLWFCCRLVLAGLCCMSVAGLGCWCALLEASSGMDSSVATNPNSAKDYTDVHLERIMNSIEKEVVADVSSSGAAADVGSTGAAVDVVTSKGQGKNVEKGVKEKQTINLEEMKSSNKLQGLKSSNEVEENQLKTVRAIGFGSMKFLKVTQLPLQSGLWLVQHFDANTCSLNIPDSDPFRIIEDLVHQVLGLPVGGIEIDKNNFSRDKKVIQQWKKQFQSISLSINIEELKEFLKEHKSAGAMFKQSFVVLCVSTLIDGKQNMNINYEIFTFLSDVDEIKDLNWSKYILDSLLLYVDQFVLEEVRAAREIPILKGWTTVMLSICEKLEIFKGRLGNIRVKKLDAGSSSMT
uniref:Uncharacterized protein n=1 Tax=Chenopodium quinoa TaxID=63459 RepID=A0A803NDD1_CHEQI